MKEIKLNIEKIEGNELIVREGQAAPIIAPEKVHIGGDINTISAYINKRKQTGNAGLQSINPERVIVRVDKKEMSIRVDFDPEDKCGTLIEGRLYESEDIKQFFINKQKTFTKEEIVKLIKFSRLHFDDHDKHAEVLRAYQSFTAKANTDIKQEADTRGNKISNYAKYVETNIPTEFILNVPIFKGQPKERFRVEICIDVTDGGARFWFESVELNEIIQTRIDEIFSEQLKCCQEYVIVNV